jgi:hypothetical protein
MYGLVLALHHDARFIKRPGSVGRAQAGFERLLESYRAANAAGSVVVTTQKARTAVDKTA